MSCLGGFGEGGRQGRGRGRGAPTVREEKRGESEEQQGGTHHTSGADWNWETSSKQTCRYIYKLVGLSCRHQRKAERRMLKNAGLGAAVAGEKAQQKRKEGEKKKQQQQAAQES